MKNIIAALNEVYKKSGYVQKQKTPGLSYSYAGEAALIEAVRPELAANGVVVYPQDVNVIKDEKYTTAKGGTMARVLAKYTFVFHHASSGESIMVQALGEAADSGDKAAAKAATIALKYALRQALLIETGDDPDKEVVEAAAPKVEVSAARKVEIQSLVADTVSSIDTLSSQEIDEWVQKNPRAMKQLAWAKVHTPDLVTDLNALGFEF